MTPKRKKVQDYILKYVSEITHKNKNNIQLYEDLFKSMSDKDFNTFMENLRDGKTTLSVVAPNDNSVKITVENNLKIAKKLGLEIFQHLNYTNRENLPDFKSPLKYMVVKMPIKRVAQLLVKKISIPEDNRSIDLTTGQVTGKSQSSKITYPEIQFLAGMQLDNTLKELLKYRGGDLGGANALNASLMKTGRASEKVISQYATGVESTKTLKTYYLGMHIKSTL